MFCRLNDEDMIVYCNIAALRARATEEVLFGIEHVECESSC